MLEKKGRWEGDEIKVERVETAWCRGEGRVLKEKGRWEGDISKSRRSENGVVARVQR